MRDESEKSTGIDRRHLLGGTAKVAALAGLTGAIGGGAAVTVGESLLGAAPAHAASGGKQSAEVKPGDLDEYYVFHSGGHSGEVRIMGAAVDARTDAHSGLHPMQRHRLGHDQRKPQDPDGGTDGDTASS